MPWREAMEPVRMQRVALVAPADALRELLLRLAEAGVVDVDRPEQPAQTPGAAGRRLQQAHAETAPALSWRPADLDAVVREDRWDLLAGEAEIESCMAGAVVRAEVAAITGWMPQAAMADLAKRLADAGGAVVALPPPAGLDPPTLLRPGARRSFSPLVETYATVPYADVDPTWFAGVAYVVMFGMMFGDVGHGALVIIVGLLLRARRPARLARFRRVWPFVVASGVAAGFFGLLYGEFFGPTGVVPVLWLAPLEEPVTLLAAALGVGAVLLAGAYVLGVVNRWREGGWPLALSAPSGVAGASLFAGLGLVILGARNDLAWLMVTGGLVMASGLALAFIGFVAAAPQAGAEGRAGQVAQAGVELFDAVIRLGANLASFARLAAFGLTHAALGLVVWSGTTVLWDRGGPLLAAAVAVFVVGNAVAFTLEALVSGVQALRLEYYELFSRVFTGEGRPYRPWRLPVDRSYRTGLSEPEAQQPSGLGRPA